MRRITSIGIFLVVLVVGFSQSLYASDFDGYVYYVDLEDRIYKKDVNSRTQETGFKVSGIVAFDYAGSDASQKALGNHAKDILRDWANESAKEKTDNAKYSNAQFNRYFDSISIGNMVYEEGLGWEVDITGVLVEILTD